MVKISVIIITYNMGHLIEFALNSLRNQTYKHFEVIVVDNYSTDNTEKIIKAYPDLSLKYLKIHNNGIISKSRNLGVNNSCGEWVAFLDADDYWDETKLEKISQIINSCASDCVAISHGYVLKNVKNNKIQIVHKKNDLNNLTRDLILKKNLFALTATSVRKSTLVSVGGFSEKNEYRTVEDYELWIKLSMKGSFSYIDEPLATIVLHDGNYSKRADIQMEALHALKCFYLDNYKGISHGERKIALQELYELETRCLQKNGFFELSINKIQEAFSRKLMTSKMILIFMLCILRISK